MRSIELVEVSPRDGLQNEATVLPTADKIELINRAISAGVRRIEVASFVNPRKVPAMADAEAVVAGLRQDAARYIGLVLNRRGADRALATGVHEIGAVCAASDEFGIRNQGMDAAQSLEMTIEVIAHARAGSRPAHAMIAVAFGCPFEGQMQQGRVVEFSRRLAGAGAIEIGLADTIGVARPREVSELVAAVVAAVAPLPVRAHFHDTRGMGVANTLAALEAGARIVDGSIGGTGGCPFAPGAAGNVATEQVAYALGDAIALDEGTLLDTADWLLARLGRARPGTQAEPVAPSLRNPAYRRFRER